ncbi:MAG: tyrosine-type recombinase/integrase [Mariniblastus sp.]
MSNDKFELMLGACPDTTWKVILALGRYGGLREPSELVNLKWEHVNWISSESGHGTVTVASPKTKRYGRPQRTIPLFGRLQPILMEHYLRTSGSSEFVVDNPKLRRKKSNLRTTFHKIREKAKVEKFPNPFRNLRLSAANDVCRQGHPTKALEDWFGHDIRTALTYYHQVLESDLKKACSVDPFGFGDDAGAVSKGMHQDAPDCTDVHVATRIKKAHEIHGLSSHSCTCVQRAMTPTGLEPVLPA